MIERRNPCLASINAVVITIGLSLPVFAAETLVFLGERHTSFPDAYQYQTIEHEFQVENAATEPITIVEGIALSGTGTVHSKPATIPPGKTATISVTQPIGDDLGTTSFRFAVITDEPGTPKHRFSLSGFVQSPYDPELHRLNFGPIDRRLESTATFELNSREVEKLRALTVVTDHPEITVETLPTGLSSEGLEVRVKASPGLPRGIVHGTASITTNVESQPRFSFDYTASVFGDIVPDPNPVEFGLIRTYQEAIKSIIVQSRSGTPFSIERATNTIGEILDVSWKPCNTESKAPSPCYRVRFSLSPEEAKITGGIAEIYVSGDPEPIPVRVNSWVVTPETVVKRIDGLGPQ